MKIAVVGGSGFVGSRMVERWLLGGTHEPRLLVRNPSSLARAARMPLPAWRSVNVFDAASIAAAAEGCEVMVHALMGTPEQIVAGARAAGAGCSQAGVRRLVYLSSASVHGQNAAPGTNDLSPVHTDHPVEYNNAKVRAERLLARLTGVEVAVLRPGIVYGPRCQWFTSLPGQLEAGRAFLVEGGTGVCNHIYVDNLAHAIDLALTDPRACDGPFYVGDDEALSWREFYRPVVGALGYSIDDLETVPAVHAGSTGSRPRLGRLTGSPAAQAVKARVGARWKRAVKAGLREYAAPPARSGFLLRDVVSPHPDWETSELHTCRTRLTWERATAFGYAPVVSAREGLDRSARWLAGVASPEPEPFLGGAVRVRTTTRVLDLDLETA